MNMRFSEQDLERIRTAVAAAERSTSGEIVPFLVDRSDPYSVAMWRGAVLAATIVLAIVLLFLQVYEGWGYAWLHTPWGPSLVTLVGAIAGYVIVALVPAVRRLLAGDDLMTRSVHNRAMRAFVEEEVFKTRDRTGILIFLSLLEHRIEVIGDEGINRAVQPDDWTDIVEAIRNGIKSDRLVDGLVEAIEKCGHLLEHHGVEIRPDDTDELSNTLRIGSDE